MKKNISSIRPIDEKVNTDDSILEKILCDQESNKNDHPTHSIYSFNTDRTIEFSMVSNVSDLLTITAPKGQLEMSILLTEKGPIVALSGISLKIDAIEGISLDCDDFLVHTKNDFTVESEGNILQQTNGVFQVDSQRKTAIKSESVEINATRGNIDIQSCDLVDVKGRLIGLNRKQ